LHNQAPLNDNSVILVIDDETTVCRIIGSILEREGLRCEEAHDGRTGMELAAEHSPNLVILDLFLPDLDGMEILQQLRLWYKAPILVISGRGEEDTVIRALELGADDYVTKPFRPRELAARVRALLRRAQQLPARNPIVELGELTIDIPHRRARRNREEIHLTRTEFDILAFLAVNLDRVVTPSMISNRVMGFDNFDYSQSLRVHVGHIRKKIEPDPSSPAYLITESGVGYRLQVPDTEGEDAKDNG
jgi:two-component system KDP operon response regulator KdpE